MPKSSENSDERVNEAYEAARLEKKPNIAKIAREYGVPYRTLHGRLNDQRKPRTARIPTNKALNQYQEAALIKWLTYMRDIHLPVTITLLQEWANLTIQRVDPKRYIDRSWAYRFAKRLPQELQLRPVVQKTKEKKRLEAEDVGQLQFWYNQLRSLLHQVPARLVYNFDECGFQPGQGKAQKVLGIKGKVPDLTEAEHAENITALECIAADGWIMTPLFIFKGKKFMESWFEEGLPNYYTAVSEKGYINDELAVEWLHKFHNETKDRTKKGEKRILIFDGHTAHHTVEFLQLCETYEILPFCFRPHTTHLCQPLDGKPFLTYKTHFRSMNNLIAQWSGVPGDKANFLYDIVAVREKTFTSRIIRNSFKERGIFPPDGSSIIEAIQNNIPPVPEVFIPEPETTPPPHPLSSSIENTPPKSSQQAEKNHKKVFHLMDNTEIPPRLERGLDRIFKQQKYQSEQLAILNATLSRIEASQAPRRRRTTKREVQRLGDSGILTVQDENRSIADRRAKEELNKKKKDDKSNKEAYGRLPPKPHEEDNSMASHRELAGELVDQLYFMDSRGV